MMTQAEMDSVVRDLQARGFTNRRLLKHPAFRYFVESVRTLGNEFPKDFIGFGLELFLMFRPERNAGRPPKRDPNRDSCAG